MNELFLRNQRYDNGKLKILIPCLLRIFAPLKVSRDGDIMSHICRSGRFHRVCGARFVREDPLLVPEVLSVCSNEGYGEVEIV